MQCSPQQIKEFVRDFIGSVPVQSVLEVSGAAFPFLQEFADLYIHSAKIRIPKQKKTFSENSGKETAAKEGICLRHTAAKHKYDIIFAHSLPSAAAEQRVLSQQIAALRPSGKMLFIIPAFMPKRVLRFEAELKAVLHKTEMRLIKQSDAAISLSNYGQGAEKEAANLPPKTGRGNAGSKHKSAKRFYCIQNPQMLIA